MPNPPRNTRVWDGLRLAHPRLPVPVQKGSTTAIGLLKSAVTRSCQWEGRADADGLPLPSNRCALVSGGLDRLEPVYVSRHGPAALRPVPLDSRENHRYRGEGADP